MNHRVGPSQVISLLIAFICQVSVSAQPAQSVHRDRFVPSSDEVFAVVRQFYDLDESQPLDVREVEFWEEPEADYSKIVFTTGSGERVPGDLAIPKRGIPPLPAVLLLHGLGNDRHRWWRDDRRKLVEDLLADGTAVLAIDLELHGERSARNDYQSPVYLTLGDTRFVRSRDMLIHSTIDARRALAVLRARGDIDADRIAVVGYSMGAMVATFIAVLEPQLKAVVACALPMTEQPLPIDPFEFAPRIRTSILLQVGRTDWWSSPDDADTFINLVPPADGKLVLYDAGHVLPAKFASDAAAWLLDRLTRETSEREGTDRE